MESSHEVYGVTTPRFTCSVDCISDKLTNSLKYKAKYIVIDPIWDLVDLFDSEDDRNFSWFRI